MRDRENAASGSAPRVTDAWVRASGHLFDGLVEANRAVLAAVGVEEPADEAEDDPEVASESLSETEWETGWSVERSVRSADRPHVGDVVRFSKTVDDEDVAAFARASGDTNPLHLDDGYAAETRFGGRIVHGTLVSGLVSAALARLPGVVIYLSQDVRFLEPVRPGDRLTAVVEVVEGDEGGDDDRFRVSTDVHAADGRPVVEGQALVLVDERPAGFGPGPVGGAETGREAPGG